MKRQWNAEEMKEAARDARRALEREREQMMEKAELMDGFFHAMDAVTEVIAENERLREENETLRHRCHYGAHDHELHGPRPVLLNHSPVALIIVAGDYQ